MTSLPTFSNLMKYIFLNVRIWNMYLLVAGGWFLCSRSWTLAWICSITLRLEYEESIKRSSDWKHFFLDYIPYSRSTLICREYEHSEIPIFGVVNASWTARFKLIKDQKYIWTKIKFGIFLIADWVPIELMSQYQGSLYKITEVAHRTPTNQKAYYNSNQIIWENLSIKLRVDF